MKRIIIQKLILVILLGVIVTLSANEYLIPELEPLRPFLNTTWKGEFTKSENPASDIQKWNRILNGTHIRIMHSLNNGEYGGESIIYWDDKKNKLAYYYFTTGGFLTKGTMQIEDGKVVSQEKVIGDANGIENVKNITEILTDGSLRSTSKYLKNGKWIEGHEIIYHQDPEAELIFK
ncbi:MAG: hypothetical protein K9N07_01045 [Candidatus Cloacimonetes bacterium]|nr:hypothetical protein [Candidatus Cloacimonadota bacterium]